MSQQQYHDVMRAQEQLLSASLFHSIVESFVHISPDPNDKEIYKEGSEQRRGEWIDVYAIAAPGLMKLANAAGINFIRNEQANGDVGGWIVDWQAHGEYTQPDGKLLSYPTTYRLDLRLPSEDCPEGGSRYQRALLSKIEVLIRKKLQGAGTSYPKKAQIEAEWVRLEYEDPEEFGGLERLAALQAKRQITEARAHILRLAETGAMNPFIRKVLTLKSTYTLDELKLPFRIIRTRVDFEAAQEKLGEEAVELMRAQFAQQVLGEAGAKQFMEARAASLRGEAEAEAVEVTAEEVAVQLPTEPEAPIPEEALPEPIVGEDEAPQEAAAPDWPHERPFRDPMSGEDLYNFRRQIVGHGYPDVAVENLVRSIMRDQEFKLADLTFGQAEAILHYAGLTFRYKQEGLKGKELDRAKAYLKDIAALVIAQQRAWRESDAAKLAEQLTSPE